MMELCNKQFYLQLVFFLHYFLHVEKTKVIQPSENFCSVFFVATGGIFLVYLINMIASFFGSGLSIMSIQNASLMSIGFSIVVVVIMALNLVLDFDFIEQGSEQGAPKYMEWYGAFILSLHLFGYI